ncbi:MAG TPA: hypothetical protein VG346_03620 [Acidimicrobiales bacterium]|jgi:hypothetical protein|nr:hypothetical protein [Acidimicrobiales bacterium]
MSARLVEPTARFGVARHVEEPSQQSEPVPFMEHRLSLAAQTPTERRKNWLAIAIEAPVTIDIAA